MRFKSHGKRKKEKKNSPTSDYELRNLLRHGKSGVATPQMKRRQSDSLSALSAATRCEQLAGALTTAEAGKTTAEGSARPCRAAAGRQWTLHVCVHTHTHTHTKTEVCTHIALDQLARAKSTKWFSGGRRLPRKGYKSQRFVPEVHHRVAGDQRIHEAHHVVRALGALLRRHLVGDDVQTLVNLQGRDAGECRNVMLRSAEEVTGGEQESV